MIDFVRQADYIQNQYFSKSQAGARRSQVMAVQKKNADIMEINPHTDSFKGWHSRGYLPHFDAGKVVQSVTFRLADSLPQEKLKILEEQLSALPETLAERERRTSIEQWLDAGMGCCVLQHPGIAELVQDTLLRFDGEHYHIIAWCIMPNHVHILLEPIISLASIVKSWKSWTGKHARTRAMELGLAVPDHGFWMREYWDRFIRNEEHFQQAICYIHENPFKAKLCAAPEDWLWSSAGKVRPGSAELQLGSLK